MLQAPMESTVTKYDRTYVTFYNVMLLKDKILFYLPDEQADGPRDDIHDPPSVPDILQWQYWDRMSDAGDLHVSSLAGMLDIHRWAVSSHLARCLC